MCGIAGFVDPSSRLSRNDLEGTALEMAATLRHRGPDDEGVWADPAAGVALGHRRLAIQDLSAEGHQPMCSADGRYVMVFNGEIYNFLDLKQQLENRGHSFRGHSDTEVMLASFTECGVESAVKNFLGMFAFALWDRKLRQLHLVRDRAGEKPLYYGWSGRVFLFGSELKALRAHPQWHGEVDQQALMLFLRHNYIPAPHSIYSNISKLPPGCILTLSASQLEARQTPPPQAYWSLWSAAEAGIQNPFPGDRREARQHLAQLLHAAVAMQMIADVPVGAFLSGGIDSSTIVAVMQNQSRRPVKTFSIGFAEDDYDEAPFAKAVAGHLGTQHTELYVHAKTLEEAIPRLPEIYDEPFADTSHIPTVLLCEMARKQVTVCLSGDAGDELFGGYSHYQRTQQIWELIRLIPHPQRQRLAPFVANISAGAIEFQSQCGRQSQLFERLLRLSEILPVPDDQTLYQLLISPCRDPENWLIARERKFAVNGSSNHWQRLPHLLQRMMYWDFLQYLPDEILTKVDRASMSVSLETRIPLLDHRIIEFAWSLPNHFRQRRGQGKRLLREVLYQYVPRNLVQRPKQGFAAPIEEWLRTTLRPWAENLLSESALRQDGFFEESVVRQKWSEHLSGKRNWGRPLWNVLMFQAWRQAHKNGNAIPVPPEQTRIAQRLDVAASPRNVRPEGSVTAHAE